MVPYAMCFTTTVFVGNSMGEGNSDKALAYLKLCTLFSFFLCLTVGSTIALFRHEIAMIFTDNAELISMVSEAMIVAVYVFMGYSLVFA